MRMASPRPVAWTIAGSDSGGGAGIQVDIKVLNAFGVHGCSVITALTAQNTQGVISVETVSSSMLQNQLTALTEDLPPAAIKTGMLGSAATCRILADHLSSLPAPHPPLVCDPVLKSTSGTDLLDEEAIDILVHRIFPYVTVLTPNIPETERLTGKTFTSAELAAESILAMGVQSVLIKGGHADGNESRDYWSDGTRSMWLSSPRIKTRATHGTGCILASAIAAGLANGLKIPAAFIQAKTFLNQCLASPAGVGAGHGPMQISPFRNEKTHQPLVVNHDT